MFPPPDSVIGRLVAELGLEVMPITGSMLNIHYGGRLVRDTRPELLPFRLPMSLRGRISFARAGLKVKRDADRYMKLIQHRPGDTEAAIRMRGLQHGGDRTFAEFLGPLHPEADAIFRALANRSIAEPEEISQGAMAALFGHVWDSGDLGRNMRGGSGLLPEALGEALGDDRSACAAGSRACKWTDAACASATPARAAAARSRARTAIVAAPGAARAGAARRHARPTSPSALALDPHRADGRLSLLTDETEPMPWDGLYSVLTPDKRFNMFFNHAELRPRRRAAAARAACSWSTAGATAGAPTWSARTTSCATTSWPTSTPSSRRCAAASSRRWSRRWQYAGPFAAPGRWRGAGGARARHRRPHLLRRRLGQRLRLDGDRRADGRGRRGERAARAGRGRRARLSLGRRYSSANGGPAR